MKNSNATSLVPIQNQGIAKVEKSIHITNKIVSHKIVEAFNKAFLLLNSKQDLNIETDFYYLIENDPYILLSAKFKFEAEPIDYFNSILLFNDLVVISSNHNYTLLLRAIAAFKLGIDYIKYYSGELHEQIFSEFELAFIDKLQNPIWYYWQGNFYSNYLSNKSIIHYSKAIKITQKYPKIYDERGMAFRHYSEKLYKLSSKRTKLAIKDFTKAIELDNGNANYFFNRAVVKCDSNDITGAFEDFSSGLKIEEGNINALFCRGIVSFYLKDYENALIDFLKVINKVGAFKMLWFGVGNNMALHFNFFNRIGDGELIYGNIEYANIYYFLGKIKMQMGKYEEAINDYNCARETSPYDSEIYFQIGNAKFNLKNYSESIIYYNQAVKLNSNSINSYLNRALANYNLEDYKEALADFRHYFLYEGYSVENIHIIYKTGLIAKELGDYSGALYYYNKVISFNCNNPDYFFERGEIFYMLNKFREAILDFDNAIILNPNKSKYYFIRGEANLKEKDFLKAEHDFSEVINLEPFNYSAYQIRAHIKIKLNNNIGGEEDYETYRKLKRDANGRYF